MTRIVAGERFPSLTVRTDRYEEAVLPELFDELNIILVLRYAGCTVCRRDIHELLQHSSQFREKNTKVFVVLQSALSVIKADIPEANETIHFISDPDKKIYELLDIKPATSKLRLAGNPFKTLSVLSGLKKQGYTHGIYEGDELQLPAVFFVRRNGTVVHAHYAADILDMPDVEKLLSMTSEWNQTNECK